MTDIASIGVAMQTDGIERGIKSLDVLAAAGPKVEKAMAGVEGAAAKTGKSLKSLGEGSAKGLDEVGRAAPKAADGVGRVAKSADDAKRALAGINASVAGLSQVSAAATQSARGMLGFGSSVQASQKSLIDMQAQVRAASTAEESAYLLSNDIDKRQAELLRRAPWMAQLDPARFGVMLNMAFQMGVDGLLGFKNTLAMVKSGDYAGAAAGMLHSKWATQTPARAERLSKQMKSGGWQ